MFGNRVLRRTIGSRREELTVGWGQMQNEKLHTLNSSGNIIRVISSRSMRWAGRVPSRGKMKNAYNISKGNRPLRRPRRRWKGNTEIALKSRQNLGPTQLLYNEYRGSFSRGKAAMP
jgi:hypothetical protein